MSDHHHHHHHHHWRNRHEYAHRAGEPGPGPNRHRLYKDKQNGMLAGVCAGIAKYYGWNANGLRIGLVFLSLFAFPFVVGAYIVGALVMKREPLEPIYKTAEEEKFWRTFSTRPRATFSELKHRFRALDSRLADLESAVTSDEYGLRKAFRDLERGA